MLSLRILRRAVKRFIKRNEKFAVIANALDCCSRLYGLCDFRLKIKIYERAELEI